MNKQPDAGHRAQLSTAAINDLPDDAFAYIEPGGTKDEGGKTTPRKLRHYPIQDKAHADNALSRADAAIEGDDETAKGIAEKALPAIKAAVKKFADEQEQKAANWNAQHRDGLSYGDTEDMLCSAVSAKFCTGEDDYAWICDFDDDSVVFSKNGEKLQASYSIDGNTVTLGDPEPVRAKTTWVPVDIEVKSKNWATPKRAGFNPVEYAPPHVVDVQIRMDDEVDPNVAQFRGYAYTIDQRYSVVDWLGEYNERIGPGASSKTLREQESIPMLRNHDPNYVFANTSSKTSQLSDDGTGLLNLASLDRRQTYTNDMCISLQRGDVAKMSFSFRSTDDAWNDNYDDRLVRELQLFDTSIVTYPANPATTAELVDAMRSALGREGRSLWLADQEVSIRSALPVFTEGRQLDQDQEDLLERALKALVRADDVVGRELRSCGRARTFRVGQALLELRAGKVLSAANHELLKQAADSLAAADRHNQKLSASHQQASDALASVLNSATVGDGVSTGADNGVSSSSGASSGDNPLQPTDGAGPRSAHSLALQRRREAEKRAIRR